jgi:predicted transcriptional regulator
VSRFAVVDGRLVDVLETLGGWHTYQMLTAEYEARWVRVSLRTVQRSAQRLVDAGNVERRETEVLIAVRNGARPGVVHEVRAA